MTSRTLLTTTSRFLSYVLRHRPDSLGLTLDKEGWVEVADLLAKSAAQGRALTRELLEEIVAGDDKQRYAWSEDGRKLRAVQGHSTRQVDIAFKPCVPPVTLYHGTATRYLSDIRKKGLQPQTRQYVHLSADKVTASAVGRRHGTVVLLQIDCKAMLAAGHRFYRADNGVWLTEAVPARFLTECGGAV